MSKLCSVCGTENRDEAQFCRACGTAFAAAKAAAAIGADGSAANVCAECGFQNKPGIRYCANCGMSLAGASGASGDAAASDAASAGSGPPPLSYPSFATVSPYPTAQDTDHSALFDQQATPDIPDPDAAIALRQQEGYESHGDTTVAFETPPAPNRAPMIVAIVVGVLAVAGVAGWLYMRNANPAPPVAAPVPTSVTPPVAATPTPAPTTAPPIIIEAAPTNAPMPAASAEPPAAATATSPPPTAVPLGTPPAAAAPLPQLGDPAVESAEAEAKRLAAEKRRDKAAKDKADREAKAKATTDQQRDQSSAAAQRAEQEAQARRRAEDAQRARPTTTAPPSPAPALAQARGVREICAGRGTIAEAVCQSRQCGLAEHANEPICRQLREADERRRNMQ